MDPVSINSLHNTFGTIEFDSKIEDQVNLCFERLFNHQLTVNEILDIISIKRTSSSSEDQAFFACLIHNLFDEYRFFSKYPDNELYLTALLFGNLIDKKIITGAPLNIALKLIADALHHNSDHKLYRFGLQSLLHFQQRLLEFKDFCIQLLSISNFIADQPEFATFIKKCLEGCSFSSKILYKNHEPSKASQERVLFILNNLCSSNLFTKSSELASFLDQDLVIWLSHYMVHYRVCIEPNFHSLYIALMEQLKNDFFETTLIRTSFEYTSSIIIEYDKHSNFTKSNFKNLGSWIGQLTLARSVPILFRQFPLKRYLIEYFDAALSPVPFTCKLLEASKNSLIFRPLNPWFMNHLSLLTELYLFADMKMSIKFEIEITFKNLGISLKSIQPSYIFRNFIHQKNSAKLYTNSLENAGLHNLEYSRFVELIEVGSGLFNISGEVLKVLLAIAIEFVIKEIQSAILERTIAITRTTVLYFVKSDLDSYCTNEVILKTSRLLLAALTKQLIEVSSQEILRQMIAARLKLFFSVYSSEMMSSVSDVEISKFIDANINVAVNLLTNFALSKILNSDKTDFFNFEDPLINVYSEFIPLLENESLNSTDLSLSNNQLDPNKIIDFIKSIKNSSFDTKNDYLDRISRVKFFLSKFDSNSHNFKSNAETFKTEIFSELSNNPMTDSSFVSVLILLMGATKRLKVEESELFAELFQISPHTCIHLYNWFLNSPFKQKSVHFEKLFYPLLSTSMNILEKSIFFYLNEIDYPKFIAKPKSALFLEYFSLCCNAVSIFSIFRKYSISFYFLHLKNYTFRILCKKNPALSLLLLSELVLSNSGDTSDLIQLFFERSMFKTFYQKEFWPLLVDLYKHFFISLNELSFSIKSYSALVKLLLITLHDIPDFLVFFQPILLDYLPRKFIQLRNFISCATAQGIILPNPLAPELKVDLLPDMNVDPPKLNSMLPQNIQLYLNSFFTNSDEKSAIALLNTHNYLTRIFYEIAELSLKKYSSTFVGADLFNSKSLKLTQILLKYSDKSSKYAILSAIVDHLRFPNRHTHFFSCLILALFLEEITEEVKELITRALLERLVAHRPHPWGVMITFIELVKNARYRFWDYSFTRSTPDIEKMFSTVAKSCLLNSTK